MQLTNIAAPDSCAAQARLACDSTIEPFDELFTRHPEVQHLRYKTFPRQETAREVIRIGDRNHWVGLFPSRINEKLVPYESSLEKKVFLTLETFPQILSYRAQPYSIRLRFGKKERQAYPDVELKTESVTSIVEIKPWEKARKECHQARFAALAEYALSRGMKFALITDREIHEERLVNASWLLSLARGEPDPRLSECVWEWLPTLGEIAIGDAFDLVTRYPAVQAVICGLILEGHICADLDRPLRPQILVLAHQEV